MSITDSEAEERIRNAGTKRGHPDLRGLLQALLSDEAGENDVARLVQLSRTIIESYLYSSRSSLKILCDKQGLTLTDLAYDCLGEAFMRDSRNSFVCIRNFAGSLTVDLCSIPEHELFLAFKGLLLRIAERHLARLFAQSDPAGAKIHRNLRDCLKISRALTLEKDFRGLVLRPKDYDSLDHLPPYPSDKLDREIQEFFNPSDSVSQFLSRLKEILVGQSEFRRSVPILEIVRILKRIYHEDLAWSEDGRDVVCPQGDELYDFEIEGIRREVNTAVKEKILLTYLARGKINRQDADAMARSLHDLIEDWTSGEEQSTSLYRYLARHLNIDEETYERAYRPKMEYLLKIARDEFASRIMVDL